MNTKFFYLASKKMFDMKLAVAIIFYVLTPFIIIELCRRYKSIDKLGPVFVAYIIGLIIGNIGILPEGIDKVQELITMLTIPLAIPLLLFSSNIRQWATLARTTFLSLLFGVLAVTAMVIIGFWVFSSNEIADLWKVSGMLIGVYTGGTPNLASLKLMLDVDPQLYILTHTYDMAISMAYLVFLMTIGQRIFHRFLPPFPLKKENELDVSLDNAYPYKGIFKRNVLIPLLKAVGIAILIFALGGGLSLVVPANQQMVVVILVITTLGIAASFIPSINKTEKTFEAGMYLILIFSIVVASMADFSRMSAFNLTLLGYVTFAVFGSLLIHVALSYFFRIDADTMMITSASLIFSPPFVPVIAGAIGNRQVIVSGLTTGLIGYAIGNYLGFAVAEILKGF